MAWRKLARGEVDARIGQRIVMLDFFQRRLRPVSGLKPRLEVFAHRHCGEFTIYQIDKVESAETPQRFGVLAE